MHLRLCLALLATAVAGAIAPAGAAAETIGGIHQVSAAIPLRIDHHINFIPVNTLGRLPAFRAYVGSGQYVRGPWANFTITRTSLSEELRYLRRRNWVGHGSFSDRRLTRRERRQFVELMDLGRDADVLVVKRGHPACAGLTMAQARGISTGRTTTWSQVGAKPADGSDRIALRHVDLRSEGFVEPRLGNGIRTRTGKPSPDGGIAAAAQDSSVAGVTSWSRARFRRGSVCAVPLNGVEPNDVTVHGLTYPGAYPIGFVTSKRVMRNRYRRTLLRRYVKELQSESVLKLFRGSGMLLARETPQPPTPGGDGGSVRMRDAQGREISPVRDDAGVTAALTGERLVPGGGGYHWAFEGDSVLRYVQPGEPCSQSEGRWTVVEGYRYSEHGGGVIAQVNFELDGSSNVVFIDIPNDPPGAAYMDGTPYTRSRDLPGSC